MAKRRPACKAGFDPVVAKRSSECLFDLGSVLFGESMFSRRTDASKIALVALCRQLNGLGYGLLDCQVGNPHLHSMGAEELARGTFETLLGDLIADPQPGGSWKDLFTFDKRW